MSTRGRGKRVKPDNDQAVRASISFPPDLYQALESIANDKKVSLAWVVRDAAEKYITVEHRPVPTGRKKASNA